MYCSLDRFRDSLSKCNFWFASDAGTVILCTHSLDVCVCGGKVVVGGEGLSTNEPVVGLISVVPQRILVWYLSVY